MYSFLPHIYRLQEHTFQQMVWDRNELLLGTPWEVEKHIKSSFGIQWDHGENILWTIEIEDPPPFPKITHMR